MTVYIDVIFIENLIINFIILYATGIISKVKIKHLRIIAGSLIGAMYSVVYYLVDLKIYSGIILKTILSVVIIYISFNPKSWKILVKQVVLFYLASFVFGGASIAIIYMVNSQNVTIQNGVLVGSYTIKTIIIGTIVAFATIIIGYNILRSRLSKKDLICEISIEINDKKVGTKAMMDTGNLLKDPITGVPVVVLEHTLFYDILPKEILNNIDQILSGDFSNISDEVHNEYISKLKVIPFSSLGKQNGMLLGIKANKLKIEYQEDIKELDKIIVGLYNKSLTKRGEYRGLLGIDVIENKKSLIVSYSKK